MIRLASAALLALAVTPAAAQMFCTRPTAPYCVRSGSSLDQYSFDSCRSEMEVYRARMREYLSCLDLEKQDMLREFNRSVDKFNCMAQGNSFCS